MMLHGRASLFHDIILSGRGRASSALLKIIDHPGTAYQDLPPRVREYLSGGSKRSKDPLGGRKAKRQAIRLLRFCIRERTR